MYLCLIGLTILCAVSAEQIPKFRALETNAIPNDVQKKTFKLSQQPDCAEDIKRLCKNFRDNNFAILDCLQSERQPEDAELSSTCIHLLWEYKRNLTYDDRFSTAAKEVCYNDPKLKECQLPTSDIKYPGIILACLMDQKDNLTQTACKHFVTKMESIVFSDYRLIYKFIDKCSTDIDRHRCGRLGDTDYKTHSQGETIECLQQKVTELKEDCQHEILRISELQSDDFHLDRVLYFACRDDRERFCERVVAGEGRVYKCLMNHKMDRLMSSECRDKLIIRQKLVAQDYKVSKGLAKACREDIRVYKCRDETSKSRWIRLSQILICLENQLHKDQPVSSDCQVEMMEHRRSVMEDFQISPELVNACHGDIEKYCNEKVEGNGKTIHCLMEHAKPSKKKKKITDQCFRELEKIMRESDVAEDWRVDPVLKEACQSVVDVACKDIRPGEARVLSCLMEKIGSEIMLDECEKALLQIQYFVSRDFRLDPRLYKACKANAVKICGAPDNWVDDFGKVGPERGPLLPCLFRYAYHPDSNLQLSQRCLLEIRRVLRQRAISVDLHPEIIEPCMEDLASSCPNKAKNEELVCLQDHLDALSLKCRNAVGNYTEEEAEHLELNVVLFKACETMAQKFCEDILKRDMDEGDLMQCLVEHKNEYQSKMDPKCKVAVEHFQMISLSDYRFSFKFKDACKNEVLTHCKNIRSKAQVVQCLSGMVRNDTLLEKTQRVGKECRHQLRVELLQRNEDINFDPGLAKACEKDREKFCKQYQPGNAMVIECLKSNWRELSSACHMKIFSREQDEMLDNSIDYTLMTTCKRMIKQHCNEVDMSNVLNCLRSKRDEAEFDSPCRSVVLRRIAQQNSDYRLNILLRKACKSDLFRYCSDLLNNEPRDHRSYQGKVIECLKDKFRLHKLNNDCQLQVAKIIKDSQLDFRQDPVLSEVCKNEINSLCKDEDDDGRGKVDECLKKQFQAKSIKSTACKIQVAKLIQQTSIDIIADPYLHKSCSLDLDRYCFGIPSGEGQQLACLITILHSKTLQLREQCRNLLSNRIQMYEYAAQVMPPESVQQLYEQVAHSPARNYFIVVSLAMIGMIFFGGLFCGRLTRRIRTDLKNK